MTMSTKEVEARLERLRRLNICQEELDGITTDKEIFAAIRKMKMGKAPGVDGILPSILRHAADAVGTNRGKETMPASSMLGCRGKCGDKYRPWTEI